MDPELLPGSGSGIKVPKSGIKVPDPELKFRIQQNVKEHINKTVNSGLLVLLDSSIE